MSPRSPENTERINVFFSRDVLDRLKAKAFQLGTSVSGLVRMIVLERLNRQEKNSGWIPINEKMPDLDQIVLVWLYRNYEIGYLDKDPNTKELRWNFEKFDLSGDEMEDVEAWMPLPNPYIRDDNE